MQRERKLSGTPHLVNGKLVAGSSEWQRRNHSDWTANLREADPICAKLLGDFVISNVPVHLVNLKI